MQFWKNKVNWDHRLNRHRLVMIFSRYSRAPWEKPPFPSFTPTSLFIVLRRCSNAERGTKWCDLIFQTQDFWRKVDIVVKLPIKKSIYKLLDKNTCQRMEHLRWLALWPGQITLCASVYFLKWNSISTYPIGLSRVYDKSRTIAA